MPPTLSTSGKDRPLSAASVLESTRSRPGLGEGGGGDEYWGELAFGSSLPPMSTLIGDSAAPKRSVVSYPVPIHPKSKNCMLKLKLKLFLFLVGPANRSYLAAREHT